MVHPKHSRNPRILLAAGILFFIWSGFRPLDRSVWFLNSIMAILYAAVVLLTFRRFRFTDFVYVFILLHLMILLTGAKYSYQMNPLFDWLRPIFGFTRNHFDRVGHYFQGLVPALMAREYMMRRNDFNRGRFLDFIVVCVVLAVSAAYELLEFAFASLGGFPMEMIMAYQGDPFDSYWDMIMALTGALTSLILLRPLHNRAMKKHL